MRYYLTVMRDALFSALIVLKYLVPFYFLAELLIYLGALPYLAPFFSPFAMWLDLRPDAALVIACGLLFNLYAAIAVGVALDLSPYEWTILGLFLGIAHSLVVETAVARQLGIKWWYALLLRIGVALLASVPVQFIPASFIRGAAKSVDAVNITVTHYDSLLDMLIHTSFDLLILSGQLILVVAGIVLFMRWIKSLPFMRRMNQRAVVIFPIFTGVILGITYGAGVLINECRSGALSPKQVFGVATFLLLCHAVFEDTLLFVLFGADALVIIVIRTIISVLVTLCLYLTVSRFALLGIVLHSVPLALGKTNDTLHKPA